MTTGWHLRPAIWSTLLASTALLVGLVSTTGPASAELVTYRGKTLDIATPGETIPNQIVVVAETAVAKRALGGLAARMGGTVLRHVPVAGLQAWQLSGGDAVRKAIAQINAMPGFHAYPNPKMSIIAPPEVLPQLAERAARRRGLAARSAIPKGREAIGGTPSDLAAPQWTTNDVSVSNQWALWRINEPLAAPPSKAVHGIAIIDTGVDYRHPDLAGKVISVQDYVGNDTDAMDVQGHGTHCSGIAAAKAGNTVGIRGASPYSKIYAYRVLDENGSGSFADIVAAIYAAADNGNVRILSLSLGGYATEGSSTYDDIKKAVDYAVVTKGKIVVVAAGNEYDDDLFYYQWAGYNYRPIPAWVPNSFTVAATTETDSRAEFSNYDVKTASPDGKTTYDWDFVDIAAPGTRILSTTMNDGYEMWSGTSMATPLVAGAAARLWDRFPNLTAAQVRTRLVNTGDSLCNKRGFPRCERRLNLYRALGGTVAGGFIGRTLDGESGQPLVDVKVDAMAGTTVAASTTTNRAGYYVLPSLPTRSAGYVLRLSRSGYVPRSTPNQGDRPAGSLKSVDDQVIVPSRPVTTTDENWRIVVFWPHTEPGWDMWTAGYYYSGFSSYFPYTSYHAQGLEANAYLRTPDGYTVSWRYVGSLTTAPFARFMHDSYGSTPMEAHVIRDKSVGTYNYWLRIDPADWGWGAIRYGAGTTANPSYPTYPVVLVYKGNALVRTINAQYATREGTGTLYWNVLNLTDSAATPVAVINKITDTAP